MIIFRDFEQIQFGTTSMSDLFQVFQYLYIHAFIEELVLTVFDYIINHPFVDAQLWIT